MIFPADRPSALELLISALLQMRLKAKAEPQVVPAAVSTNSVPVVPIK
jgi:hypothetical protein